VWDIFGGFWVGREGVVGCSWIDLKTVPFLVGCMIQVHVTVSGDDAVHGMSLGRDLTVVLEYDFISGSRIQESVRRSKVPVLDK
jgi:hypothetical protein